MTASHRYANDVISGKVVAGKRIYQACKRFLDDLKRDDIYFDEATAERYTDFAEQFLHLWEDQWRGERVHLAPFQKFIIQNIFGWKVTATNRRKYRTAYIQTARKQGKTTLMAVVCWLHLILDDSTDTPAILVGANDEKQAKICTNSVGQMVSVSPALKSYHEQGKIKLGSYDDKYDRVFYQPEEGRQGVLEAISRDPGTKDGFNPSLAIVDEFHESKTSQLLKVMQSGQVTRSEPLLLVITTAGFNKAYPCYSVLRKTGVDIMDGAVQMDSRFIMIYEHDGEHWSDQVAWKKTNPLIHDVPAIAASLKELYDTAKLEGGASEVDFRTKNLNEWVDAPEVWISADVLKQNAHGITEKDLIGLPCYGGLDAAKSLDLNAFALFFPNVRPGIHAVKVMYWIPADKIDRTNDVADYWRWEREGWLIKQPGNVIDHVPMTEDIIAEVKKYDLKGIGFDAKYAYQVIANFVRIGGYPEDIAHTVQQGFGISAHVVTLEKMLMKSELDLMSNPVLFWNFGNTKMEVGSRGDRYPTKMDSRQKIDGVTAVLDAIAEWKRREVEVVQDVQLIWLK